MKKPHTLLAVRGRINRHARLVLDVQRPGPRNGVRFPGEACYRFAIAKPPDQ
jgi:hypothetical protein